MSSAAAVAAHVTRQAVRLADEVRARQIYFPALAALRSNLLDAADISDVFRAQILIFLKNIDANAPSQEAWDRAIANALEKENAK